MEPIFSDEYIRMLHEACEELKLRWYQCINQIMLSGGNWDKMQELAIYTSHSNPAKRHKYNPQKLRKTDLYLRNKPPIIRRS